MAAERPQGQTIDDDIRSIALIDAVPAILDAVCRITQMRFAAIARVTDETWTACAIRDGMDFGLQLGGELELDATICNEVRQSRTAVVISEVATDAAYRDHPSPKRYEFQSQISVPIFRASGEFFGTLCAIDRLPAKLDDPGLIKTFELFAELIALHLEGIAQLEHRQSVLVEEQRAVEAARLLHSRVAQFSRLSAMGTMASSLAHEINQPLVAVSNYVAGIRKLIEDKADLVLLDAIDAADENVHEVARIVKDMRRTLDIEPLVLLPVALDELVAEASSTALLGRAAGLDCRFDLAPNLFVQVDAVQIFQVIFNLLANALDAMSGSARPSLSIRTYASGDEAYVEISDTGPGLGSATAANLYKAFWTTRPGHVGIGLTVCRTIVEAHGGHITARNEPTGAVFTFTLKLAAAPVVAALPA